ncbi:MAG: hypothetical protein AAF773_23835 [Cyanobacteria bacterium P01_D01_bin.115]
MRKFLTHLMATGLLTVGVSAIAAPPAPADMGHDHGDGHSAPADMTTEDMTTEADHGHHDHGMVEIPAGQVVPEVVIDVFADSVAGWNVAVAIANWSFAPEQVNINNLTTEGHAHLYLNGEKLTRLYSEWYYIPELPPGEHVLTVGLNTNTHEALMHDGMPIEASIQVIVPEAE